MRGLDNQFNSSVLQALIDCKDYGLGSLTIDKAITKLQTDAKLLDDLSKRFENRNYNNNKIEFVQVSIDYGALLDLPSPALKVLLFLAFSASQSGTVSASAEVIMTFCHMSHNTLSKAMRQLYEAGFITTVAGSRRHEAPIYQVNPAYMYKGKRKFLKSLIGAYEKALGDRPGYIKHSDSDSATPCMTEAIYRKTDDGDVYYTKVTISKKKSAQQDGDPAAQTQNLKKKDNITKP